MADEFVLYCAVLARPDDEDRLGALAEARPRDVPDGDYAAGLVRMAEADYLAVHGPQRAVPLAELVDGYEVHRGVVAEVTIALDRFCDVIDRVLALAPVRHVNLAAPREPTRKRTALRSVLRNAHVSTLTSLFLDGLGLDDADAVAIAFSQVLYGLPYLSLAGNRIDRAGVEALAASPWLVETDVLDLRRNPCNPLPHTASWMDYGEIEPHTLVELRPFGRELVWAYGEPRWLRLPPDIDAWPPPRDLSRRRRYWSGQSLPGRPLDSAFGVAGLARTTTEAHLYMDLRPCLCGARHFPRESSFTVTRKGVACWYVGSCPDCGQRRVFGFLLPPGARPGPPEGLPFGGSEPSQLLDPGEWLKVSDEHAASAMDRADPRALAVAVAALDEVLKFLPPDASRRAVQTRSIEVPEAAFTTAAGQAVRAGAPERFRVDNLVAARCRLVTALD